MTQEYQTTRTLPPLPLHEWEDTKETLHRYCQIVGKVKMGLSLLVTRYGARLPLIIGPIIAAVGFVLFALPDTEGSHWTTFFPAIVVLGFGMSLVIAPLTTAAMSSVEGRHSGLASGVNNAVSRAAGLLAIPLLGIFVFLAFLAALDTHSASLELAPQAQHGG